MALVGYRLREQGRPRRRGVLPALVATREEVDESAAAKVPALAWAYCGE